MVTAEKQNDIGVRFIQNFPELSHRRDAEFLMLRVFIRWPG